jgi:hypothetical protein
MKKNPPNEFRVKIGLLATFDPIGMMGVFTIPTKHGNEVMIVVVNDDRVDKKWEHVSVSLTTRCPTWEEMCYVKSLFWEDDETVAQFHPKKSEYKNFHPYCLHMWRDTTKEYDLPPSIYVAP